MFVPLLTATTTNLFLFLFLTWNNNRVVDAAIVLERNELQDVKIPKPLSDHTASALVDYSDDGKGNDGLIYLAGGCDDPNGNVYNADYMIFTCNSISSSFYALDTATNTFITTLPDMPRPRYRHAAVASQNQIWLVGGRNLDESLVSEVDVFDIRNQTWKTFTLPDGYVSSDLASWGTETHAFFAGGYDANYTALDKVFSIDVVEAASNNLEEGGQLGIVDNAPLLTARGDLAATVNLETGYAYVSGGFSDENEFCEPIGSVERYSLPPGNTWIDVASLPTARADKALVSYKGNTIAMGGEKQMENKCEVGAAPAAPGEMTVAVDDIEVLNDDDSTWDILTELPEHRFRFAAVVYNDMIYTFGGQQAYEEDCNCLKTTDEVVTYVDVSESEAVSEAEKVDDDRVEADSDVDQDDSSGEAVDHDHSDGEDHGHDHSDGKDHGHTHNNTEMDHASDSYSSGADIAFLKSIFASAVFAASLILGVMM